MNAAPAELHPAELAATKPQAGGWWRHSRWLLLVALIFAAHVGLLFMFGGRKPIVPRAVANVPTLELADHSSEWLALNDPTLFALPHQKDFASALRLKKDALKQPLFHWTEPPRLLSSPSANELGLAFNQFMRTNRFAGFELQLKPPLKLSAPEMPIEPVLAQNSTLRIEGELARRQLSSAINLTNWPYAGVIAPSKVQVLVDTAGNVISTVLLPPDNGFAAADQYGEADQLALEIARTIRFAPASHLTVGRMIFDWHTVPVTTTNEHE